jgi:antitoxin CcdA
MYAHINAHTYGAGGKLALSYPKDQVMTDSLEFSAVAVVDRAARIIDTRLPRKPTNVTLNVGLVAEAKQMGINVSQAAEAGLASAVAQRRAERWLANNKAALASSNAYVEEHGLPYEDQRLY